MHQYLNNHSRSARFVRRMSLLAVILGAISPATAQQGQKSEQKMFRSPDAAADALMEAFKNNDERALLDIFGREHEKLVVTTDKVERARSLMELYQAAQQKLHWQDDGPKKKTLILGAKDWPFPIPLVKAATGWRFDTAAGEEEIINRRVGQNELEAIETCRAYISAQVDYAGKDRDGDEVLEYAQKLGSTKGKRDGLYWEADSSAGEEMSPFGPRLADAAAYLEAAKQSEKIIPFHGYYFRILTRQGKNPPGGEYNYIINGHMIAGFAMVAWPADYGSSGVMTILVSHQGKIYEKDLGEKTPELVSKISAFDPDSTWEVCDD